MASRALPELGICQWFHYEDYDTVRTAVRLLRDLGVRHLRTGVSWADFYRPGGRRWYDWQMKTLAEFEVLLSVWHTPPSIAEEPSCAAPPRRLEDYMEFVGYLIDIYPDQFAQLELWNEPNNRLKWNFPRFDPTWTKFARMVQCAGWVAREKRMPTVLGGMIPVDPEWLRLVRQGGGLDHVDIVAIHGFPEMWWPDRPNWDWHQHWHGWGEKVASIAAQSDCPVWITETGLATWDFDHAREGRFDLQSLMLRRAAVAPVERVYWYSLIDLDPGRPAIEGFHVDENEYHLGLVTHDGKRKPAYEIFGELLERTATKRIVPWSVKIAP